MKSTPGVLRATQFIDSEFRRGRFLSQNQLAAIIERETGVLELIRAIQSEAARRAVAAGQSEAQWQRFLWPEAQDAFVQVFRER